MVKKKGKSKRTTLKDKYKIQRRVVESHRKSRKQAKRDAKAGIVRHDKKKKDPGIPNSWPFKQDLLNEIERAKERSEAKVREAKERRREGLRALHKHQSEGGTATTLEELMAQASQSRSEFHAKHGDAGSSENGADESIRESSAASGDGQASRRAYLRTLRSVVSSSDVLLQILDARDPIGTRISPTAEDAILSQADKRMVLVLNKIDLIPKSAVTGWLNYLRRSHPAVAIKAGTNQSRTSETKSSVGRSEGDSALQSTSAVGVESLLGLLKNYARNGDAKGSISVGIIGYPNVGKSSILNTLKRSRAVGVSPRPGFTTSIQEVILDKTIRLIDSPGVVFADGDDVGLRNCVDVDSIPDPIPAVQSLLGRCQQESLMMTYEIPAFPKGDVNVFLALVAKKRGRVLKGGVPDKMMAARGVLRDWNGGIIPYFTPPPVIEEKMEEGDEEGKVVVVSQFGEEFDVGKMDGEVLGSLEEGNDEMDFVQLNPSATVTEQGKDEKKKWSDLIRTFQKKGTDDNEDEDMEEESDNEKERMASKSGLAHQAVLADADDYDFDQM